jgi:AcrR family transcriptional regulator
MPPRSKEEILRHVLIRQFDGAEATFAQVLAARSSPSDRLMLALDMYANYVRQNRRLLTSLFGVSLRSEGDIDGAWRERLLAAFVPLVREAMDPSAKEARDPDIAARLLLSTYTFAVLRIGLWRDIAVDDTALGSILHRIVADMIGPRAAVMR